MDANELTFGVEFEVTLPLGTAINVGSYRQGVQIPDLPAGWVAKHDSSIHARGRIGAEIVSPVLKGDEGARQLKMCCEWLARMGAKVNRSTGFHVHVGWVGDDNQLKALVHLAANFEKAFYAVTGTKSRERGSFCRPVRNSREFRERYQTATASYGPGRYHLLNVTNLYPGSDKRTVEFRCFCGTTNLRKAAAYVRMCLALVCKALDSKRLTKWESKVPVATSPIHRSGEGQTELTRLFYAIGWTKGRVNVVLGNLAPEVLPSLKATKKELMRLAKQYDRQQ